MLAQTQNNLNPVAVLNDRLRTDWKNPDSGQVMLSMGVRALARRKGLSLDYLMEQVARFDKFSQELDPYSEKDFGNFYTDGEEILFEIEYFDKNLQFPSKNPADPDVTRRLLTLMLREEY